MSNGRLLFVFEGQKSEINIIENVSKNFSKTFPNISANENVKCAYCTTIYSLYKAISKDEYLDMFMLLKEKEFNKEILKDFNRVDFAEIYLFFDYDGHTSSANDDSLSQIINLFNEETAFGKIFISYPMVEALKHISSAINFKELKFEVKKGKEYKKIVNQSCDKEYTDFNKYNKDIWVKLVEMHLKKMNFIVNNNFSIPNDIISQDEIFLKQLEKYIHIDATIAVLSAFPVFIFDYYGYDIVSKLIKTGKI